MISKSNKVAVGLSMAVTIGAAVVSQPANAQITHTASGYLMRVKYSKGEHLRYAMQIVTGGINPQAQKMQIVSQLAMDVLGVQGNVATLTLAISPFTMNGKVLGNTTGQKLQIKVDNTNKFVGGSAPNMPSLSSIGGLTLPEKPIKVGETFTRNVTMNTGGFPITMKTTYKFVGLKNVSGRQVAQLNVAMNGTGSVATSGTGTTYLNVSDGSLMNSAVNLNTTINTGQQGAKPISMKMSATVTRK